MKKILLSTTGLIGAAMLSTAAHAETPTVTVGGFADFRAGYGVDDINDADNSGLRKSGFRNDTEITIRVDGKSDAGLGYGAVVALEADVTDDGHNQGTNAARTYVYLDGGWGRFELGSNEGSASTMSIDADNISATGDTKWASYLTRPKALGLLGTNQANATGATQSFITNAQLPIGHGLTTANYNESQDNANKITYYSPRFSGVQLGVSYTSNNNARGQNVARNKVAAPGTGVGGAIVAGDAGYNFNNIWDVALNYDRDFGDFNAGFSATGTFGNSDSKNYEDLAAYAVGLELGFQGFSVAGSYGDWGDSGRAAGFNDDESDYYSVGAAYEAGAFGVSATYFESSYGVGSAAADNKFNSIILGADYKLAPGLTPYAEVGFFEMDAAGANTTATSFDKDVDGTTIILGTTLSF